MNNRFFFLIVSFLIISCASDESYLKEIQEHQYELNVQFADAEESPLTPEDLQTFKELDFFEIHSDFKINADLVRTPDSEVFEMQTTTDRKPLYKQFGIAKFKIDGKSLQLSIYQNQQLILDPEYEDYLFIPFNDTTNGNESYSGGRFLDLKIPDDKSNTIIIDFNKVYNPYCAYSGRYSCPIPPPENNLEVAIKAGVKAYKKH